MSAHFGRSGARKALGLVTTPRVLQAARRRLAMSRASRRNPDRPLRFDDPTTPGGWIVITRCTEHRPTGWRFTWGVGDEPHGHGCRMSHREACLESLQYGADPHTARRLDK